MHFTTSLTALIAFTSTTSAGTLHDRRRDNRFQMMRRNRGPILQARHNGQHPGGVEDPVSDALSTSDAIITITTALEGLNSTTGLDAPFTTAILESTTSEVILLSETAAVDATACATAVTVTVTETVLAGGETQSGGESASIVTTISDSPDPALTTEDSASIVTPTADPTLISPTTAVDASLTQATDGAPPFTFVPNSPAPPPAATNVAEIEQPALEQPAPTPLEDGDVTTQIFTQTISTPAATLVLESTVRRGRNRGKVVTITEETEESVETEVITLVVTQSERIELVTSERGVAGTPTAIVVDGIASEAAPAPEIPAATESAAPSEVTEAAQTSELITDGNAPVETSTSCTDASITITSSITVDATAPAATTSAAPEIQDANENVVSMISVITLTKSAEPFITTTDIDGVPALTSVTPAPELVLSTITLGPGGATGTDTEGAQPTGGQRNGNGGNGKGKGKGRKNKNKGGNGKGRGGEDDGEEERDDENENGAGNGNGRNHNNAAGRGQGNGSGRGKYGVDD